MKSCTRFYLRNTSQSVKEEWERVGGRMRFRVNTMRLDMTLVERGFYDEQVRAQQLSDSYLDHWRSSYSRWQHFTLYLLSLSGVRRPKLLTHRVCGWGTTSRHAS